MSEQYPGQQNDPQQYPVPTQLPGAPYHGPYPEAGQSAAYPGSPYPGNQPMQHGDVTETGVPSPDGYGTEPWKPAIGPDGVPDFSPRKPRPTFRIRGETYYGKIEVPVGPMLKYSARAAQLSAKGDAMTEEEDLLETLTMFRLMLVKDSADRLIEHMHLIPSGADEETAERISAEADGDESAVGFETFTRLLPWIMEQYGMAPTAPSPESPDGSQAPPDDGSNSTATSSEPA